MSGCGSFKFKLDQFNFSFLLLTIRKSVQLEEWSWNPPFCGSVCSTQTQSLSEGKTPFLPHAKN